MGRRVNWIVRVEKTVRERIETDVPRRVDRSSNHRLPGKSSHWG